ncbi:MAG: alpha/beta hydrolase [Lysobacteraceae bacterium]
MSPAAPSPPTVGPATEGQAAAPFRTQAWGEGHRIASAHYAIERVTFPSAGVEVVGNLFLPAGPAGPRPAVAVIGPVGFVKEQSPVQYASRLAREGFVALVFDPRHHGESAGEPRRLESGQAKADDLRAALDFLATRPEVDAAALHLLGLCQGVNWAVDAANADPRVRSLALVAGHYLTPDTARLYLGSDAEIERRIARSHAAEARFRTTGGVDYIPIVADGATPSDPEPLLGAPAIRQFYLRWADRGPFWHFHGLWENRLAAMSEAGLWGHRVDLSMATLRTPTLMVHADRAASGPEIPLRLFASIPTADKALIWLGPENQMQFYEDPLTIDRVVPELARFHRAHGAGTT